MNHNANNAESDTHNDQNNWYAKLHPIGTVQQTPKRKRLLNLSIFFRISNTRQLWCFLVVCMFNRRRL